ncbi:acyl carrier protein [Streptomyces sp. NPDC021356]|uniref:acyl carrier protein n=1 Tax=Streptomyces sp. NPDC021356 TaxID=3154900 RepID=UPI00340253A2
MGIPPEYLRDPIDQADPAAVLAMVSEVLGVDVPADGTFIGYGGDSFNAVVLIFRIHEAWGVEMDLLTVLNSTLEGLVQTLNAALAELRQ